MLIVRLSGWKTVTAALLLCSCWVAAEEPAGHARKRPLPPLEHRAPEVRQNGAGEAPPRPQAAANESEQPYWESLDSSCGEVETYTPQPLCEPPAVVPTTGLGPTVLDPNGDLFRQP